MAGRNRFFVEEIQPELTLTGEEFQHAKNVLRLSEGDEVTLLDNSGTEYSAIITSVGKKELALHVVGSRQGERESATPLYLLCGALKGDKTELVVQKATELGVKKIGVFASQYCAAYMNENKLERLQKVAKEAAKQCMRSVAPEVVYFSDFSAALQSAEGYENKLFACEFATTSDIDLRSMHGSTALVVGSEGGFAEAEFTLARSLGFAGITLGKRILRAETAAISLTAVAAFVLGDLQ